MLDVEYRPAYKAHPFKRPRPGIAADGGLECAPAATSQTGRRVGLPGGAPPWSRAHSVASYLESPTPTRSVHAVDALHVGVDAASRRR
jgi:hypothetical protein